MVPNQSASTLIDLTSGRESPLKNFPHSCKYSTGKPLRCGLLEVQLQRHSRLSTSFLLNVYRITQPLVERFCLRWTTSCTAWVAKPNCGLDQWENMLLKLCYILHVFPLVQAQTKCQWGRLGDPVHVTLITCCVLAVWANPSSLPPIYPLSVLYIPIHPGIINCETQPPASILAE